MTIAITGARGRLGRVLRGYLAGKGLKVLAFSRNADAAHKALGGLQEMIEQGRIDVILHLAWSTVPATAERSPGTEWNEDLPLLASMLRHLDRLKDSGIRTPRLIFFSSCSVYGEQTSHGEVFDEASRLRPLGWYARGKRQAEELMEAFAERGNPVVVLRVTNPYGFAQADSCMQGVIPALAKAAVERKAFNLWGGDGMMKDFLHISDLCSAVESVARSQVSGLWNVASGLSVRLAELICKVENITGRRIELEYSDACTWDVRNGRYSNRALTAATGWTPNVGLDEGLSEFVHHLMETRSR
jgi:UDP-glucose 4-epimerase